MIAQRLLDEIRSGKIKTVEELELAKIKLAGGKSLVKNSQILELASPSDPDYDKIKKLLKIKNVRTASGVANIAVMWMHEKHENSCPANCIYCPQGKDETGLIAPKSYTGVEPTTLRAIRNDYDPFLQVTNRIKQLNLIGHSTDKCELIIMGGTFMATPTKFQEEFVKRCLDGFNNVTANDLDHAQLINEAAANRCIGMTVETRADFCSQQQIEQMLKLGCTRVEIGVQSTDDNILKIINRGHNSQANIDAIKRLKENGLKVCVHWMPGLTGLSGKIDEKKEIEMFSSLFTADYMPDELKIYPTLVVPGTKLYELWRNGRYTPLNTDQMIRLLIEFKKIVPLFVRIKRVMRDISEHKSEAGARVTNLRQLAKERMKKENIECRCIRCREVGHTKETSGEPELKEITYDASDGKEIFLSYENGNALLGFLRLRLSATATVRELHVYGSMVEIGKTGGWQHRGLGKKLLEKAEEIAKSSGYTSITVTSGIGVRTYYEKLGYSFESPYMTKNL
ncbi:MAG: tRNA uridine(34) 5-carboxymethylaminomethyl modification radical SAM/GNAT enzyme Elp3 [Candidatus Aenigmatarchaeota archaeon]